MTDPAQISDGYHTMAELYDYRAAYNALAFNEWAEASLYDVHKSWRHHDGELCFGGGWFVVMAELPTGQISNHYPAHLWDWFQIESRPVAAEWDSHTPADALRRITDYLDGRPFPD